MQAQVLMRGIKPAYNFQLFADFQVQDGGTEERVGFADDWNMKSYLAVAPLVLAIVGTSSPFTFSGPAPKSLSGSLAGAGFQPDNVKLTKHKSLDSVSVSGKTVDMAQGYSLTFAVGKDFIPDNELVVRFNLDKGSAPFGKTISCKPFSFATADYRAQHYRSTGSGSVARGVTGVFITCSKPAKGLDSHHIAMDLIDATITFSKKNGKTVTGTVDLRLSNALKTHLSGQFTATLEDF